MKQLKMLWSRIRSLGQKPQIKREIDEELQFHIEQHVAANIASGMSPDDAAREARKRFGNVQKFREECRDVRGASFGETLIQDIRFGLRLLRKSPAFTLIAVLTLALGICGVTTQFSVIDAVLLRGLPFSEPDQLVRVAMRDPAWAPDRDRNTWLPDIMEFKATQKSFTGLAGYYVAGSFILTVDNTPQRFSGSHVTQGFFSILGVSPARGRDFTDSDHNPNAPRVTIISDALWKSDFGSDPNVLGRTVRLNGKVATVIGVMPPGFTFPRDQLWMPMFNEFPLVDRPGASTNVLGRLKPGVSIEQATAEFEVFLQNQATRYPETNKQFTVASIEPLLFSFVGRPAQQLLVTLFCAVAAVLVIACINVMNMQFARSTARWRELAVRAALGASRHRLIRQMLTESMVLAAVGAIVGIIFSYLAIGSFGAALGRMMPGTGLPPWITFEIDGRVLAFTVIVTVLAVLLAGLLPAVISSRTNLLDAIKQGARGHTSGLIGRITGSLVVGQIALTCGLLIASLLLVKSISNQFKLDFGYDTESVLIGRMNFEVEYRTRETVVASIRRILAQLRSSSAVENVAFTSRRNMMTNDSTRVAIEGENYPNANDLPQVYYEIVSDQYFATLGLRPLEGREFEASDTADRPPVVLVNQPFARRYFPGASPVGRRIRGNEKEPWSTIVGVVPDTLMQGPLEKNRDGSGIFLPVEAAPSPYLTLVARGRVPNSQLGAALRQELAKVELTLPIYNPGTPRSFFDAALGQGRTIASLFSIFAGVSVVLAAVGLYGVMSFAVGQRIQEIGIRMALGARRGQIMRMVLSQGGRRLAIGAAMGMGSFLALVYFGKAFVTGFLYKVNPYEPTIYFAVVGLLALATALACFFPARRAAKVDPMVALRYE